MNPLLSLLILACTVSASPAVFGQPLNKLPFERGVRVQVSTAKPAVIKGGDYDDKQQRISLKVKLSNVDTRQSYENYQATLSAFGQSAVDRKVSKVLMQEKFAVTLAPLKSIEHECKEVHTRFDKTDAKFGFSYDGWLLVVKDAEGKVVFVKSTSPSLEKLTDKVDTIVVDSHYNRALEVVNAPAN